MTEPPASPASSDIAGVSRDRPRIVEKGKKAEHDQQEALARPTKQDAARPPNDHEIAPKGNAQ